MCTTHARMPLQMRDNPCEGPPAKNPKKRPRMHFRRLRIQSNTKQPALRMPNGVWNIVWEGGVFLAFAAVPSGMSSRWGVLFFPLAAAMPFSKLRLATRCVPSRGSCYVLRSQKGRVLPHVRLPRVHFQSGVSFTTLALPRCAPPHVPATRAFPWEPSPIMGGSFQTCACHALTAHQGCVVPRLGLATCACHALLAPSCVSFQTTLALPGYEAPLRVVFSEPAPATLTPAGVGPPRVGPLYEVVFSRFVPATRWLPIRDVSFGNLRALATRPATRWVSMRGLALPTHGFHNSAPQTMQRR